MTTYRIIAYGGDMSAQGMGNEASIKAVDAEHVKYVDTYMELQEEHSDRSMLEEGFLVSDEGMELWKKLDIAVQKLFALGIFAIKYDARSSWAWMEYPKSW